MRFEFISAFTVLFLLILFNDFLAQNTEFIKGVDISSLLEVEDGGGKFMENNVEADAVSILKRHSINFARLKIWHTPDNVYNSIGNVLLMAERIKAAGMKLLLDFHYSDTWADPAYQTKPRSWQDIPFSTLKDSLYQYTKRVITALKNHGVLPDKVQLGNEISCGFLWNEGRVCGNFNDSLHWKQFGELLKSAIDGVKDGNDSNHSVRIMIHTDRGGDNEGSRWFFNNLLLQKVEFDIIGFSYYPWWQGTFENLRTNAADISQRFDKDIIIVETAYPWTLDWFDGTNNIVGNSSQLLNGYPATAEGQKRYLIDLMNLVKDIPGDRGLGIFYWEPTLISAPQLGSVWENMTFFDFSGNLLSSISAFDSTLTSIRIEKNTIAYFQVFQNYPNPFNPSTYIKFGLKEDGEVSLLVYDMQGKQVAELIPNRSMSVGEYEVFFNASNLSSGTYVYTLISGSRSISKKMMLLK